MITLRLLTAIAVALVMQFLVMGLLADFEIRVRVLRPWQRIVYGCFAFLVGLYLAWCTTTWGGW